MLEFQDEQQIEFQEREKKKRERDLSDLKKVLAMPEGRRLLWRLLSEAGVFRTTFTGNSQTFLNEGRRQIGLLILSEIMQAKPEAFTQMQREYVSELKAEKKGQESV